MDLMEFLLALSISDYFGAVGALFLTAGGLTAGGGAVGLGADAAPPVTGPGEFWSYNLMMSPVISVDGSANNTGVCCELTSMIKENPWSLEYLLTTAITRCPSSCMTLPCSCSDSA